MDMKSTDKFCNEVQAVRKIVEVLLSNDIKALAALERDLQSQECLSTVKDSMREIIDGAKSKESVSDSLKSLCIEERRRDVWVATESNWVGGELMWMTRDAFDFYSVNEPGIFSNVAVYFLWSDHYEVCCQGQLYIGETIDSVERIKKHSSKAFWTKVAIVSSSSLTKSIAVAAEGKLQNIARASNRYELQNKNSSAKESLSLEDIGKVNDFVESLQRILSLINLDFLQVSSVGDFSWRQKLGAGNGFTVFRVRLLDAVTGRFIILKGSEIWTGGDFPPKEIVAVNMEDQGHSVNGRWIFNNDVNYVIEDSNKICGISTTLLKSFNKVRLRSVLDRARE